MRKFLFHCSRFARNTSWVLVFVGVVSFVSSALLSFVVRPVPSIHDEFAYLLSADTFAHGRLSNPTPSCDSSFESIHILTRPTYASKYPPAQGVFLAAGQLATGNPLVGVWLSVSLAVVAITWMLYSWLPPNWAFGGAMVALTRLVFLGKADPPSSIIAYWSQSYYGGAVPALGGALAFAAIRRMSSKITVIDSFFFGLGVALLLLSRPFEGLLAILPAVVVLAQLAFKHRHARRTLARLLVPMTIVTLLAGTFTLALNKSVTGNALLMPYSLSMHRYFSTPLFWFQSPANTPQFTNHELAKMDRFASWQTYLKYQTPEGRVEMLQKKLETYGDYYFGPVLALLLLGLPLVARNKWTMVALAAVGSVSLGAILETFYNAHYIAPITCLLFFVLMQSARALWHFAEKRTNVAKLVVVLVLVVFFAGAIRQVAMAKENDSASWARMRAAIISELSKSASKNLIFVRYGPQHTIAHEWVYNDADIPASKVLWVRDLGPVHNKCVLDHFKDRQIWLLYDDTPIWASNAAVLHRLF